MWLMPQTPRRSFIIPSRTLIANGIFFFFSFFFNVNFPWVSSLSLSVFILVPGPECKIFALCHMEIKETNVPYIYRGDSHQNRHFHLYEGIFWFFKDSFCNEIFLNLQEFTILKNILRIRRRGWCLQIHKYSWNCLGPKQMLF